MVYVGIDIAKRVHVCAILDESNTVVVKPFRFHNDAKGFKKLLVHIERLGLDASDILIGMEATGSLFENLYRLNLQLEENSHFSGKCRVFSEVFDRRRQAVRAAGEAVQAYLHPQ